MREDNTAGLMEETPCKYRSQEDVRAVVVNICLVAAYCGYCYSYFNTINFHQDFAPIFDVHGSYEFMNGLISFTIPIGAALGAYFSSHLMEHHSRRRGFEIMGWLSIVTLVLLQIRNVWILVGVRLVQGIAVGAYFVIASIYVKEFVPLELSGKYGPFLQLFFVLGMIYSYLQTFLLALIAPAALYWRWVFGFPLIFIALHLYRFEHWYRFETPKYLIQQGYTQEARQLLTRFIKDEYVEQRMGELKRYIDDMHHHEEEIEMLEMDDGEIKNKDSNPNPENKKRKCQGGHRLATKVVYHLAIMQQMTAIQVVYIYVGEIVLQVYPSLYMFIPVLVHSQGVFAIFLSMQFTKTYGRKDILQFGCLGCAISLFVISASFFAKGSQPADALESLLIVGSLFALRIIFSFTFAALYPMYISEIAEPKAISDCSTYGFVIAAIISLIFPLLQGWFGGPAVAFLIFGLYTFGGWIVNREFMVETKDKIEVQIRQQYQQLYEKWFKKTK